MLNGFYTQDFFRSLPETDSVALARIGREFLRYIEAEGQGDYYEAHFEDYLEAVAILSAFLKARGIQGVAIPVTGKGWHADMQNIHNFFRTAVEEWQTNADRDIATTVIADKKDAYSALFETKEPYVFSDTEMQSIQNLANELRDLISGSNLITADHKRRLLRRLEAMQRELHKKTSDIDRFWGFVAEAGIVTRKFGEDLKPISDRVTELGKIVIGVIMAKEGIKALPDITKLLGN